MYVSATLAGSVFVVGIRDDRSVTGPSVCLFYISTSSELSNNKPTSWSRGNRKS